jgi:hypothetical protein
MLLSSFATSARKSYLASDFFPLHDFQCLFVCITTSKLVHANSAAIFDKVILIYDSFLILSKSLTFNLHVDIGVSISKLVSVHLNFVVWVVLDWWVEI